MELGSLLLLRAPPLEGRLEGVVLVPPLEGRLDGVWLACVNTTHVNTTHVNTTQSHTPRRHSPRASVSRASVSNSGMCSDDRTQECIVRAFGQDGVNVCAYIYTCF